MTRTWTRDSRPECSASGGRGSFGSSSRPVGEGWQPATAGIDDDRKAGLPARLHSLGGGSRPPATTGFTRWFLPMDRAVRSRLPVVSDDGSANTGSAPLTGGLRSQDTSGRKARGGRRRKPQRFGDGPALVARTPVESRPTALGPEFGTWRARTHGPGRAHGGDGGSRPSRVGESVGTRCWCESVGSDPDGASPLGVSRRETDPRSPGPQRRTQVPTRGQQVGSPDPALGRRTSAKCRIDPRVGAVTVGNGLGAPSPLGVVVGRGRAGEVNGPSGPPMDKGTGRVPRSRDRSGPVGGDSSPPDGPTRDRSGYPSGDG